MSILIHRMNIYELQILNDVKNISNKSILSKYDIFYVVPHKQWTHESLFSFKKYFTLFLFYLLRQN